MSCPKRVAPAPTRTTCPPPVTEGNCIDCHTSEPALAAFVPEVEIEVSGCPPPPLILGPFMFLVSEEFLTTTHGKIGCQTCHKGQSPGDVKSAHEGLVPDPSVDGAACKACHEDIVSNYATAVHNTQRGQLTTLEARSYPGAVKKEKELAEVWKVDCATCHTSCGSCHVSHPKPVLGGLLQGHQFLKTPPVEETCSKCHGKIVPLYLGEYGFGDVHWLKANMSCIDCHRETELHGSGEAYTTMHAVEEKPKCTDCHDQIQLFQRPVHFIHQGRLSCYVCHSSGPSPSCFSCHLGFEDGEKFRYAEKAIHTFKIGLNPYPTRQCPYQ
ncbi:MAG: hypothetical protein QMC90_05035, partial [Dehalococcoidales bacterium]|nr:hypothetical protein [Dehalococcoidales bacterium]